MMRQRLLHPNFFTDARLLALSPLHRLLFEGLWCLADREGKLEDGASEIKIRVLPLDNCDVEAVLVDLDRVGLIRRYDARGRSYILIPTFLKYQHPHPREMKSSIPDPEAGGSKRKSKARKDMPRTDLGLSKAMPVPSGSSDTGSSGSSNTDPPPPTSSSAEQPVVVIDRSGKEHNCNTAPGFWSSVSVLRDETGLPRELEPPSWSAWYARTAGEVGPELLLEAYFAYRRDEHFRDRGWPTAIFMSDGVWRPRARIPVRGRL